MNSPRLEKLLDFLKSDENDCFTLYAIALEYLNSDKNQAKIYFEKLLEKHPNYVPTYYKAAELYIDLGDEKKVKATFEKGIKTAQEQQEYKTQNELNVAYNNYLLDLDGLL